MTEVITTIRDGYGIIRQPITTNNPQAKAMMERPNQTLGKMRRTQNFHTKADMDIKDPFAGLLSAVRFAMRATVHTTTRVTPSQLVFNRHTIHNIRIKTDWTYIKTSKQMLLNLNNIRENAEHSPHPYQVDDLIAVKTDTNRIYDTRLPYP